MKILVTGDRDWQDDRIVTWLLTGAYAETTVGFLVVDMDPFEVIHGDARGADSHAKWWTLSSPMHGPLTDPADYDTMTYDDRGGAPVFHWPFPASWDLLGKRAGPERNSQMLREQRPDVVLAFHDDLKSSKGTRDMVQKAQDAGVPVYLISRL